MSNAKSARQGMAGCFFRKPRANPRPAAIFEELLVSQPEWRRDINELTGVASQTATLANSISRFAEVLNRGNPFK
jgi:hypothetical protein